MKEDNRNGTISKMVIFVRTEKKNVAFFFHDV